MSEEKTYAMSIVLDEQHYQAAMQIAEMNGTKFTGWVRKKILQDALLLRIWTIALPEDEQNSKESTGEYAAQEDSDDPEHPSE